MKTLKLIVLVYTLLLSLVFVPPAAAQLPTPHRVVKVKALSMAFKYPKKYALQVLEVKGWDKKQYACLVKIWTQESHWNYRAKNPTSTAYGIGQLLTETSKDPATQIRDGIRYLTYRYGSPCQGWQFWKDHYYY